MEILDFSNIKFGWNQSQKNKYQKWSQSIEPTYSGAIGGEVCFMFRYSDKGIECIVTYERLEKFLSQGYIDHEIDLTPFSDDSDAIPDSRFTFDNEEQRKFSAWLIENNLSTNVLRGDYFEFYFVPTGLGTVKKVKYLPEGLEIDLTDYDSW